jgi:hypothetical protein
MRVISFIERHQTEVIEKTLRHCGLWEDEPARGPPEDPQEAVGGERLKRGMPIKRLAQAAESA